jgi:hypothetical protein
MCLCLALCVLALAGGARAEVLPAAQETRSVDTRQLREGSPVSAALAALNEQGFRVVYSSALVRPDMTLQARPRATRIDELLREILSPWKLHAVRASNGDWLIAADDASASTAPDSAAPAVAVETIDVIDVTGTRMRLAVAGASEVFLERRDVERMPHLADDAMRMLKVLPGVSGGDISAALNIRGGRREEALLSIDGAEIHNAFHFRDIDGALSVLDTSLVQGIDFSTGGMTADVGDYMSGAVGLSSHKPSGEDEFRSGVGISFVSAYARSSGVFAEERGSWLVSARRGFLDVLTERVVDDDEQLTPRYTDVFAAANFQFTESTSLSARFLLSDDDLRFITDDDADDVDSAGEGHSRHLWFTLNHDFSDDLRSTTLLSAATVAQSRDASGTDDLRFGTVHSDNEFTFVDFRQDWTWALGDTHLPRWGITLGDQHGDYDYSLDSTIFDPLVSPVPIESAYATDLGVDLRKAGAYAAWRARVTQQLTAEAGVRWDTYRYDGGEEFDTVSPRLNLVYSFGEGQELRAAWGVMHQPQAVNELQVEDNVTQFFRPERVRQVVVGYTHHFQQGISARLDVYDKAYSHLRPRYENALDPVQMIPEGAADRVRIDASEARARGVELTLRREALKGFAGWVSYAYARAEDREADRWVPRTWEQRQTLSFGGSWTGTAWNVSFAGLVHSGTPTTELDVVTTPLPGGGYEVEGIVGPRNGARLDAYARVDMRVNREIRLANSKLSIYMEVTNLLNRKNECCIEEYRVEPRQIGPPVFVMEKGYWLPLLPSFGFQWEF